MLYYTVFLLKIRYENNNIALPLPNFYSTFCLRVHSIPVYSIYAYNDLCRKIRDYIQSFGKGCRIIRRAEFLQEIRYSPKQEIN